MDHELVQRNPKNSPTHRRGLISAPSQLVFSQKLIMQERGKKANIAVKSNNENKISKLKATGRIGSTALRWKVLAAYGTRKNNYKKSSEKI